MKTKKRQKRKQIVRATIEVDLSKRPKVPAPPLAKPAFDPVAEDKYIETLDEWFRLECKQLEGQALTEDAQQFLSTFNVRQHVDKMNYLSVMDSLIRCMHNHLNNPFGIGEFIEYNCIRECISCYFDVRSPRFWDITFCEIIAASVWGHEFVSRCSWGKAKETARRFFAEFANSSVSEHLHSDRFYVFMLNLFFRPGTETSLIVVGSDYLDSSQKADLMRGLIAQAKKNNYIWSFETYLDG